MGIKGYSWNPTWSHSDTKGQRRIRANKDIANRCIKQYKGKALQDLKVRLRGGVLGPNLDSVDFLQRPNGEVWVLGHASWASHAYRIESEAARERILGFMDYVETI